MALSKGWKWLFGPIDNEVIAIEVLNYVSKGWYGLTVLVLVIGILLFFSESSTRALVFLWSAFIYLMAGYFLPKRRSRTFSVVLLACVLIEAFLCYHEVFKGGNIVLGVLVLLIVYRGMRATFVYHGRVRSMTQWKNVMVVWCITIGISVLIFVGGTLGYGYLEALENVILSDEQLGMAMMALLTVVSAFCFIILPKRFPFTTALYERNFNKIELATIKSDT